jgi:hypothetical protein
MKYLYSDYVLAPIHGNILSEGVADITKSKASHTAVLCIDTTLMYEASIEGVVCTIYSEWIIKNKKRIIGISDNYWSDFDISKTKGKRYDLGKMVNFVLYRIFSWLKLNKLASNVINRDSKNSYFCSELNALCRGELNPHLVIPEDILNKFC